MSNTTLIFLNIFPIETTPNDTNKQESEAETGELEEVGAPDEKVIETPETERDAEQTKEENTKEEPSERKTGMPFIFIIFYKKCIVVYHELSMYQFCTLSR